MAGGGQLEDWEMKVRLMFMKARARAHLSGREASELLGIKTARAYGRFLRYPRDWTLAQARLIVTLIGLTEEETKMLLHEDLPDIAAAEEAPKKAANIRRQRPMSKKEKWENEVKDILRMGRTRSGKKLYEIASEIGYGTEQALCVMLREPQKWSLSRLRTIRTAFGLTDEEYQRIVSQY